MAELCFNSSFCKYKKLTPNYIMFGTLQYCTTYYFQHRDLQSLSPVAGHNTVE